MLKNMSGVLAIIAVDAYTILILKLDICNAYISMMMDDGIFTFYWQLNF